MDLLFHQNQNIQFKFHSRHSILINNWKNHCFYLLENKYLNLKLKLLLNILYNQQKLKILKSIMQSWKY